MQEFPRDYSTFLAEDKIYPWPCVNFVDATKWMNVLQNKSNRVFQVFKSASGRISSIVILKGRVKGNYRYKLVRASRISQSLDRAEWEQIMNDCWRVGMKRAPSSHFGIVNHAMKDKYHGCKPWMHIRRDFHHQWQYAIPHVINRSFPLYEYDIHGAYPGAMQTLPLWDIVNHGKQEYPINDLGIYRILPDDPLQVKEPTSGLTIDKLDGWHTGKMVKEFYHGPLGFWSLEPAGTYDFSPIYEWYQQNFKCWKHLMRMTWSIFKEGGKYKMETWKGNALVKDTPVPLRFSAEWNPAVVVHICDTVKMKLWEVIRRGHCYRAHVDSVLTGMTVDPKPGLGEFRLRKFPNEPGRNPYFSGVVGPAGVKHEAC